ncbi:MAG: type I-E CRISPR-associated protein Cas5/CasD [Kiritimatiellaeota bacterium]|nr:type I-E CRISPR-associated protein Cas5/CasD [Kiritimatiellota bacterium]
MSDQAFLAMMLDAPLQSWGFASRFQRRTTALHPTRSGILGMVCAALGVPKGSNTEKEWLAQLESVRLMVLAIQRLPEGCRQPLDIRRLEDYHTVSGTRRASGAISGDAVISHRQYLLDAKFGVILAGPHSTLKPVAEALRNPRWGVWFGRKNCIPAAPIVRGLMATPQEALAALGLDGRKTDEFARVEETASFADGTDTLMDVPVNFQTREFKPRRICRRPATLTGG